MKQSETEQKKFSSYRYIILLILTLLSFQLADNIERNSVGLIIITLLLSVNLYFFIKVRRSNEYLNGEKIYTLFATALSSWFFLHCLLCVNPTFGESISNVLNLIGFDLKGSLNYKAFSFFMANLFYLGVSIIEIRDSKSDKPIYLTGIVLTSYIILNYLLFHSNTFTIN